MKPETNFGRELLDYCTTHITDFTEEYGTPPTTIALVLAAEKDGRRFTEAYSWDATGKRSKMEICSTASTMLLKRAME